MSLSDDLISQLVKATKSNKKTETDTETTVFGTIVYDGRPYVKLDGSDQLTPISTTADVQDGERVTVMIKNHTATVTGNMSSPAARTDDVKEIGNQITEFEIIIADKVSTEQLEAQVARIDNLEAENVTIKGKLEANEADISELKAENVTITGTLEAHSASIEELKTKKLDAEVADITYATIKNLEATNVEVYNLKATYGEFVNLTTEKFTAVEADITRLDTEKLSATEAALKYANIDFSNIGEAAIEKIFSESGIIKDLIVSEGTITGELVGVTIKGDLIEGGTIIADKLVVLGEDGLYYKLNVSGVGEGAVDDNGIAIEQTDYNSLNGSVITAKSITATQISVDDLVAFGATIGGFHITTNSLYSGVKESADNSTTGVYMDSEGQFSIGDETNYLKFYKDENDTYRLDISAASVLLKHAKSVEDALDDMDDKVDETVDNLYGQLEEQQTEHNEFLAKFSKYIRFLEDESGNSSDTAITIGSGDSAITLSIDNELGIVFKKNGVQFGWWDGVDFHTGNVVIETTERAQFGNFAFIPRSDGSLSLLKVGG